MLTELQLAHLRAEVMRFPPLLTRPQYLKTDHIETFPNLMGSVHSFTGTDREHTEMLRKKDQGDDWTRDLAPTDVMLTPAACYPLYPTAAGTLEVFGGGCDGSGSPRAPASTGVTVTSGSFVLERCALFGVGFGHDTSLNGNAHLVR